MGEILIYLIIATSLGLLAGWAITWTSARQKLVSTTKKLQIQLNDRSSAVKQLKETLQEKIKEVEDFEYELMRRTVDRPEKLIGQGGTAGVRAYEDNVNEALDQRDQRIAELEALLENNDQGDIVIDINQNASDNEQKLTEALQVIETLKAQLKAQPTIDAEVEVIEVESELEEASILNEKVTMRELEKELKSCLNEKKQHGETLELRTKIDQIKSAILEELKTKRDV